MDLSVHSPASPVQEKLNEITLQMQEEALLHKRTPEDAIEWGATESQKGSRQVVGAARLEIA